ncbi:MAG: DNA polymerase III subunit gamma/tau [Pseudomonadota bacterium]|nr:DNA polymerase III subunit gamma/tau [Pseudomonadota bacterium]
MLGQEHVVRALSHALETGRLHHAYLFTGTRGVGKTTLARILAKCLNCERGVGPAPCGECSACLDIDAGRFGDLLEVDAATNTRVEEMRELLDNSQYRPVTGRYKVYIIDEVHMLSRHAFNAMLKTLEEPPAHMKFILATTDPQKVPVTVLSRCLQFALKPMTVDQLVTRLDMILRAEQVDFEPAALRLVARAGQGSVRDSLSLLDQAIAFGGGRIEEGQVADLLGVAAPDAVLQLAESLLARSGPALLAALQQLISAGHSAEGLLQDFARLMQQLAVVQLAPGDVPEGAAEIARLAAGLDAGSVQLCWQIALAARRDLVHAPDEAAGLTMAFLRMLTFLPPAGSGGLPAPGAGGGAAGASKATGRAGPAGAGAAGRTAGPAGSAPVPRPVALAPEVPAARDELPASASMALPDTQHDWLAVVDRLPPAGVALELARHCVWQGREGSRLQLRMAQAHKALLTTQTRLVELLRPLLGAVQLDITLEALDAAAAPAGSAASRDDGRRAERQREAEGTIAADPVVGALLGELGGRLVPGSVRPRGEAA